MRLRAASAALACALLLAGCAEDAPADAAPAPPEALVVTDANDRASLEDESFRMQAHQHDYWGGRDRLVVMEATRADGTFFISPEWSLPLVPEPGSVVPQGTARVEVAVSWADGTARQYARPELWVRTAADHEAFLVGPVEQGATLAVATTLAQADLPHQSLSAWRFEWRIHPPSGESGLIWWDGEVTMRVEAVRGLEIPVYPPHPDAWQGAEALPLLDEASPLGVWQGDPDGAYNCFGQCPATHRPANGSIVPYDAALVEVVFEPGPDSVTGLGLRYHAADSREWKELEPDEADGARRVYRIPVGAGMGDSPYASQSQWEIQPHVREPAADSAKVGSYRVSARALREA